MEEEGGDGEIRNWSMTAKDPVGASDIDGAISFVEPLFSKVDPPHLDLASDLIDLANLYSSKGFSVEADDALTHPSFIGLLSQHCSSLSSGLGNVNREPNKDDGLSPQNNGAASASNFHVGGLDDGETTNVPQCASQEPSNTSLDDDWETIVDHSPDDLVIQCALTDVSKLSLEDYKIQTPNRRGRGTFSAYKKDKLYSDQLLDEPIVSHEDETIHRVSENDTEDGHLKYGTHHVLVLADFAHYTKTVELEKLYENFIGHGVSFRWVNDTLALAIFPTPSIALEAYNKVHCPFTVRILQEDDPLITTISKMDLRPPRPRPRTSARTAQRLIGQVIGVNLGATSFGSEELRKQEEARRNRILARKTSKDDAWGNDEGSN